MQPIVVKVIVINKSARMFNLNENKFFPYRIIVSASHNFRLEHNSHKMN